MLRGLDLLKDHPHAVGVGVDVVDCPKVRHEDHGGATRTLRLAPEKDERGLYTPRYSVPPEPLPRLETLAVPFRVAQPWSEATRGYRAIVIDSAHRNEADLRTLGEELRGYQPSPPPPVVVEWSVVAERHHRLRLTRAPRWKPPRPECHGSEE